MELTSKYPLKYYKPNASLEEYNLANWFQPHRRIQITLVGHCLSKPLYLQGLVSYICHPSGSLYFISTVPSNRLLFTFANMRLVTDKRFSFFRWFFFSLLSYYYCCCLILIIVIVRTKTTRRYCSEICCTYSYRRWKEKDKIKNIHNTTRQCKNSLAKIILQQRD